MYILTNQTSQNLQPITQLLAARFFLGSLFHPEDEGSSLPEI
jgi:hypothetical protein